MSRRVSSEAASDYNSVNQLLFRMSSPNDGEQASSNISRWTQAGAFPSPSATEEDPHVFADDSYADESYNEQENFNPYKLNMVKEETSRSSADAPPMPTLRHSDTPAVLNKNIANNANAEDFRTPPQHPQRVETKPSTSSSGVSDLTYPYALYNNLAKARDEEEETPRRAINNRLPIARAKGNDTRLSNKVDTEESSSPFRIIPGPTAEGEESSTAMIDQQSDVIETVTTRSQQRRYIRHTLPRSQQVTIYSAAMLKNLFVGIEQKRHMHKLTAQHMRVIQDWMMFAPAVTLTLMSGILIFVFETNLNVSNDARVYAAISAGITALLSVFWQALNKQLDLGTQGALHECTSESLNRLSEDILLTLSSTEAIPDEYVALVGEKFDQAMDTCPSTLPYKLEAAFTSVSHRLNLMLNPPMGQAPKKHVNNLDMMRLYANAYDELTSEIIHHVTWPFIFPEPRSVSDTALRNFMIIITEGRDVNRSGWIQMFCPCLNLSNREKSFYDIVPTASIVGEQDSVVHNQPTPKQKAKRRLIRSHMLGEEI